MIHDSVEQSRDGTNESGPYVHDLLQDVAELARIGSQRDRIVVDEGEALEPRVAVGVKEWQRAHDPVGPLPHGGTKPRLELQSGDHHAAVKPHHSLGSASRSTAHEYDGWITRRSAPINDTGSASETPEQVF